MGHGRSQMLVVVLIQTTLHTGLSLGVVVVTVDGG